MTDVEIYEAHAELHNLRADLWELHGWAENALTVEHHDRQYIAEHLTDSIYALLARETPPQHPF